MPRLTTSKYLRGDSTTTNSEEHEHECDKCGGINTMMELPGEERYECSACGDICDITEFTIRKITIAEFGAAPPDEIHIWVSPSGTKYVPGDRLEVRHTREGSFYNEDIIVVHCPGFPGGICEVGGTEIRLPSVEPTSAYFVGPASAAWAWQYRQGQYLLHLASQRRMGDFIE